MALAATLLVAAVPAPAAKRPPHIKHVFILVLENQNYETTFGADPPSPYLANRLTSRGELLKQYYAIAHESNPNYLAMISGQSPNGETQSDCQDYSEFAPGTPTMDGQYIGQGCVYPNGVETIANQLEDSGYTWRGYMQDMNASTPAGDPEVSCRHPAVGAPDDTQQAGADDQYATRHNPFVYFHQIIDFDTCAQNDVDLRHLRRDLKHERTTPNYSFITPDLCNDAHDSPCPNGRPGGMEQATTFLRKWVPRIRHSRAFRHRGLLMVTFDEAEDVGGSADASACCDEQPGPNTINPGGPTPGPGGGRIGSVLLSPCIRPGTVNNDPYNHYSMLRWVEDNFGQPHLGYAGQSGLKGFDAKVLNRHRCGRR
jgi:phospholipase C